MKTRYVLVKRVGNLDDIDNCYYGCIFSNQGRFHYDDPKEALESLEAFRSDLKSKLGIENIFVIASKCYNHGDSVASIFSHEYVEANTVK